MKKLFSIFFVLAMLLPVSMYGTPPNVTWNLAWEYANSGNSVMNTNGYSYRGALNGVKCYRYQWDSDLQIYFCFSDNSATWTSPISGATCVMPARGTYTVSTTFGNMRIGAYNTAWDGNTTQSRYVESGTSYHFTSGTWYVEEGVDGPCIWSTDCYLRNAGTNKLIIGDPAVYKNVTVRTDDNTTTKGTVSYSMLSGYVYTTNITDWKQGSTYRLTASAKSGYRFVRWEKNGSQISTDATTDVIIDDNATYTAYFESQGATQYTISTAVSPVGYGTVSGAGQYYENDQATLTATSANEHLYFFDHWEKAGVNVGNTPTITPTVTAAATYTAVFRAANAGTITANANNANYGTVTGGGSYNGGDAVTLTATPSYDYQFIKWNDGNTNSTRTVYVDGNATYTATFARVNNIYTPAYFVNGTSQSPAWIQMVGESNDFRVLMAIYTSYTAGSFTHEEFALANSKIIDKLENETIMVSQVINQASITIANNIKTFNATIVGDNGLYYNVTMEATTTTTTTYDEGDIDFVGYHIASTNLSSSCSDKYDGGASFSDDNTNYIHANGTGTVDGTSSTLLPSVELFKKSGSIPTGVYTINNSGAAGTARTHTTYNDYYGVPTLNNGCHVYVHNASDKGDAIHTWFMRAGRVNVVNTSGSYFIDVQGFNSVQRRISYTAGTKPSMKLTANGENGGTVSLTASAYAAQTGSGTYQYGTWVTLTPSPSSAFLGWEGADHQYIIDNGDGSFKVKMETKNLTLQAKFAAVAYTLGWNANGGELSGDYTAAGSVNAGATITAPTATRAGYRFTGWSPAFTGTMPSANTTYTAQWEEAVTFTIADYTNGTVTVTPDDGSGAFTSGSRDLAVGTMVSFSAVASTNYHISTVNLNIKGSDNSFSASSAYTLKTGDGTVTLTADFLPDTYAITYNAGANGTGTIAAGEKTYNVNFTLSSSTFTRTGYTQTGWSTEDGGSKAYDLGGTYTANTAVTLYPYWEVNSYDITFKNADGTTLKKLDGTTDAVYSVAYGETPAYDGATPTKAADSEYTYTFNAWTPAIATVTTDATYTATYSTTKVQYTLTWDVNGGNELTGTYTSGTIDWGTAITKPADPTKAGYTFNGWDADNDGTADDVAATMPTSDVTYKALWILSSMDALTLLDKESATYYDNFQDYDGVDVETVTYTRNFTAGNWSTLCLPFDVTEGNLILNGLNGQVFAFQHATGNANVGSQVLLYFSQVSSLDAGVPYLVRTRNNKSNFTFENVTINTEADTEADITALGKTHMTEGTIALVGTLRKGTLPKGDKHYMGLMGNKIYYPGVNTTVPAYRAYFYDSNPSGVQQRVRIVVDGEDMGELLIDNGELLDAGGDDRAPRKYIRNGVLVIECNGVTYDAQGKRM